MDVFSLAAWLAKNDKTESKINAAGNCFLTEWTRPIHFLSKTKRKKPPDKVLYSNLRKAFVCNLGPARGYCIKEKQRPILRLLFKPSLVSNPLPSPLLLRPPSSRHPKLLFASPFQFDFLTPPLLLNDPYITHPISWFSLPLSAIF